MTFTGRSVLAALGTLLIGGSLNQPMVLKFQCLYPFPVSEGALVLSRALIWGAIVSRLGGLLPPAEGRGWASKEMVVEMTKTRMAVPWMTLVYHGP